MKNVIKKITLIPIKCSCKLFFKIISMVYSSKKDVTIRGRGRDNLQKKASLRFSQQLLTSFRIKYNSPISRTQVNVPIDKGLILERRFNSTFRHPTEVPPPEFDSLIIVNGKKIHINLHFVHLACRPRLFV